MNCPEKFEKKKYDSESSCCWWWIVVTVKFEPALSMFVAWIWVHLFWCNSTKITNEAHFYTFIKSLDRYNRMKLLINSIFHIYQFQTDLARNGWYQFRENRVITYFRDHFNPFPEEFNICILNVVIQISNDYHIQFVSVIGSFFTFIFCLNLLILLLQVPVVGPFTIILHDNGSVKHLILKLETFKATFRD